MKEGCLPLPGKGNLELTIVFGVCSLETGAGPTSADFSSLIVSSTSADFLDDFDKSLFCLERSDFCLLGVVSPLFSLLGVLELLPGESEEDRTLI